MPMPSSPSCGGACTSSAKARTWTDTVTTHSAARWSKRSKASHCGTGRQAMASPKIRRLVRHAKSPAGIGLLDQPIRFVPAIR
jgi:hypothetical protein